ncbi:MAG: glycosyltransferase family 9 protein, partial [Candidatus Binatia bacterium]
RGNRFLTVRFPATRMRNAYGGAAEFANALGVQCPTQPLYEILPDERAAAVARLAELGLVSDGQVRPFVAAFVGGHLEKRWPQDRWLELLTAVQASGARLVVFIGPEEVASGARLQSDGPVDLRLVPPQPLRAFAALLGHAALLITPDSGPMHLAVALRVPTLALLQRQRSWFYAPQGADDRALFQPSCADVLSALTAHPRWPAISAG